MSYMNLIEPIFLFLALIGAVISSLTDIKKGIIPNRLTLPLIGFGLLGNLFLGIFTDISIFIDCITGVFLMFVLGYIFWVLGGWSAGDVKELLFIAALLPYYPGILEARFNPSLGPYPFIFTVVINTFLAIFPVVAIYSIVATFFTAGLGEFFKPLDNWKDISMKAFILLGLVSIASFLHLPIILIFILVFILKIDQRKRILLSTLFLIIYIVFSPLEFGIKVSFVLKYFLGSILIFMGFALLFNSFRLFRIHSLQKEKLVSELEEGDVLAKEIYMLEGRIFIESRGFLEKIKDAMEKRELPPTDKHLIAGTSAAGITKKEKEDLYRLAVEGKIQDRITVKKSMPFAPIIMIGLIISLTVGDLGFIMRGLYG